MHYFTIVLVNFPKISEMFCFECKKIVMPQFLINQHFSIDKTTKIRQETDRDRQRQTEPDRDGTETDRDGQR